MADNERTVSDSRKMDQSEIILEQAKDIQELKRKLKERDAQLTGVRSQKCADQNGRERVSSTPKFTKIFAVFGVVAFMAVILGTMIYAYNWFVDVRRYHEATAYLLTKYQYDDLKDIYQHRQYLYDKPVVNSWDDLYVICVNAYYDGKDYQYLYLEPIAYYALKAGGIMSWYRLGKLIECNERLQPSASKSSEVLNGPKKESDDQLTKNTGAASKVLAGQPVGLSLQKCKDMPLDKIKTAKMAEEIAYRYDTFIYHIALRMLLCLFGGSFLVIGLVLILSEENGLGLFVGGIVCIAMFVLHIIFF